MFRKTLFAGLLAVVGLAMFGGCGVGPTVDSGDTSGRVAIALTNVPADGTCIQVEAVGYRTVQQTFVAAAGSSQLFSMKGLPLGQVTFTAAAFGVACPAPGAAVPPNWVSDAPFTTTVAVSPASLVTLNLVRNGGAKVSIGFNDQPDGGQPRPDGGALPSDAAAQPDGSTGGPPMVPPEPPLSFMKIPGVEGKSTAKGFEDWFIIDTFTLKTLTTTGVGGGSVSGKTSWALTASLRFQKGMPQLHELLATGKNMNVVDFVFPSTGAVPAAVWSAKIQNATLVAIDTLNAAVDKGVAVPMHTLSFVFQKIDLQFNPPAADGQPPSPVKVSWDLRTSSSDGALAAAAISSSIALDPDLRFTIGGTGPFPSKPIISFHSPSETASRSTGGGGTAGKPIYGDASISLPLDGSALAILIDGAKGKITRSLLVEFVSPVAPDGNAEVIGAYGFKNVQFTGVTLSGPTASFSFKAAVFTWTFDGKTITYDSSSSTKT